MIGTSPTDALNVEDDSTTANVNSNGCSSATLDHHFDYDQSTVHLKQHPVATSLSFEQTPNSNSKGNNNNNNHHHHYHYNHNGQHQQQQYTAQHHTHHTANSSDNLATFTLFDDIAAAQESNAPIISTNANVKASSDMDVLGSSVAHEYGYTSDDSLRVVTQPQQERRDSIMDDTATMFDIIPSDCGPTPINQLPYSMAEASGMPAQASFNSNVMSYNSYGPNGYSEAAKSSPYLFPATPAETPAQTRLPSPSSFLQATRSNMHLHNPHNPRCMANTSQLYPHSPITFGASPSQASSPSYVRPSPHISVDHYYGGVSVESIANAQINAQIPMSLQSLVMRNHQQQQQQQQHQQQQNHNNHQHFFAQQNHRQGNAAHNCRQSCRNVNSPANGTAQYHHQNQQQSFFHHTNPNGNSSHNTHRGVVTGMELSALSGVAAAAALAISGASKESDTTTTHDNHLASAILIDEEEEEDTNEEQQVKKSAKEFIEFEEEDEEEEEVDQDEVHRKELQHLLHNQSVSAPNQQQQLQHLQNHRHQPSSHQHQSMHIHPHQHQHHSHHHHHAQLQQQQQQQQQHLQIPHVTRRQPSISSKNTLQGDQDEDDLEEDEDDDDEYVGGRGRLSKPVTSKRNQRRASLAFPNHHGKGVSTGFGSVKNGGVSSVRRGSTGSIFPPNLSGSTSSLSSLIRNANASAAANRQTSYSGGNGVLAAFPYGGETESAFLDDEGNDLNIEVDEVSGATGISGKKAPKVVRRSQVKIACTHCKKACKKCDEERPCGRCVRLGLNDCKDSERKERKRGVKRGPYRKTVNGDVFFGEELSDDQRGLTEINTSNLGRRGSIVSQMSIDSEFTQTPTPMSANSAMLDYAVPGDGFNYAHQ